MNDFAAIVIPVWAFWFLVVWIAIDATKTTISLINQFLEWRLSRKQAAQQIKEKSA